jgi:hypothetical protein
MRRIFKWLNKRFGTLDLLPEYFTAAGRRMQDVLWGALLPFVVWGIWFIVSTPPTWVNVTAVGIALFLAGYYVWRADHGRLIPGMNVLGPRIHYDNAHDPAYKDGGHNSFIQLLVRCASESPLYECEGYIVRVREYIGGKGWRDAPISGPLQCVFRGGSNLGVTQHPGAEFPLDFVLIEFKTQRIRPWSHGATEVNFGSATEGRAFRFNLKLTYSDRSNGSFISMKPVDACIDMTFGGDPFTPMLDLVEEIHVE